MRIVMAWVGAVVLATAFVAFTSIGPVWISFGWRHGIHATDFAVIALLLGGAAAITRAEVASRGTQPTESPTAVARNRLGREQRVNEVSDT